MPRILRHDIIDKSMVALAESVASIITADDNDVAKAAAMTKTFEQFGDYLKSNITTTLRKADEPRDDDDPARTNTIDDDKKLSGKLRQMVAALITAAPSLSEERAMHFLLHTAHGRKLAEHLNSIAKHKETPMPQVDIMKLVTITEDALMAQAKLHKRYDESDAKAFARVYENDIEYRKQWAALTDAKHLQSYLKSLASLEPTSTEVGSTQVSDDSAEAVRLLQEMADRQHRTLRAGVRRPG